MVFFWMCLGGPCSFEEAKDLVGQHRLGDKHYVNFQVTRNIEKKGRALLYLYWVVWVLWLLRPVYPGTRPPKECSTFLCMPYSSHLCTFLILAFAFSFFRDLKPANILLGECQIFTYLLREIRMRRTGS